MADSLVTPFLRLNIVSKQTDKSEQSTTVCNVKVAYIRPKYSDLRAWMADPNNVYIGRRGIVFINNVRFPPNDSIWANPYKVSAAMTREMAIAQYETYIIEKIRTEHLENELEKLRGKNLGCWCKPEACHGDVLLKLLNK